MVVEYVVSKICSGLRALGGFKVVPLKPLMKRLGIF